MIIQLNKKRWVASPITGHKCFLGRGCDLWWRKNDGSFTCGLTNFLPINRFLASKEESSKQDILYGWNSTERIEASPQKVGGNVVYFFDEEGDVR